MATEESKLKAIETKVNGYAKARFDELKAAGDERRAYNTYAALLKEETARRDSSWTDRSMTVTEATKERKLGDANPFDRASDPVKWAAVDAWDKWQQAAKTRAATKPSAEALDAMRKELKGTDLEPVAEVYVKQIEEQAKAGKSPSVETLTHKGQDDKTYTIKAWIAHQREINDEEKAVAEAAAERQEGLSNFEETIKQVSKGAIIKIDGTSKAHEAARLEIANALERYFANLDVEEYAKALKALGLKEDEFITNRLTSEDGSKIVDRKLLAKALKLYQTHQNLVPDGKVGSATLEYLLYNNSVWSGNYVGVLVQGVAQALPANQYGKVGQLCGKRNLCELQEFDEENEENKKDPRYAEKVEAKRLLGNISGVLYAAGAKIEQQEVKDGYTDKEAAAMKALFAGVDGKAALLDPSKLTNEGIKAFQKAFGLKVDGVIGTETGRALTLINLRLATEQVIDPSEIRAAVMSAKPVAKSAEAGK